MLIPPLGRSSRQKTNERVKREAVDDSLRAASGRAGGAGAGGAGGTAPQGAGLELGGVSLLGKLGFGFGFSGFGGPDYLFPADTQSEAPERLFWELT